MCLIVLFLNYRSTVWRPLKLLRRSSLIKNQLKLEVFFFKHNHHYFPTFLALQNSPQGERKRAVVNHSKTHAFLKQEVYFKRAMFCL